MKSKLTIDGMSCNMCVRHVQEAIESVPGVSEVEVSLDKGSATFELGSASMAKIIDAIEVEGYSATEA